MDLGERRVAFGRYEIVEVDASLPVSNARLSDGYYRPLRRTQSTA